MQGARPLFFLDYFGTGRLQPHVAAEVVKGLAEGCRAVGCALVGGETAEMPGMYQEGEYDLAGCIVGLVERGKILDGSRVAPGDILIGLASDGLHTNGYSLARYVLLDRAGLTVDRYIPELGQTLGDALLAPHRCYAPAVLPLLDEFDIHAMAHITGGGFYDNIPRALPADCQAIVERSAWTPPAIFQLIQETGPSRMPKCSAPSTWVSAWCLSFPPSKPTSSSSVSTLPAKTPPSSVRCCAAATKSRCCSEDAAAEAL